MAHQLPRAIRAVRRRSRPPARDQCSWCAGPIRGQNRPKSPGRRLAGPDPDAGSRLERAGADFPGSFALASAASSAVPRDDSAAVRRRVCRKLLPKTNRSPHLVLPGPFPHLLDGR